MTNKEKALIGLVAGLLIGALAQSVVKQEAAVLGLSAVELALLGIAAGGVVRRIT